MKLGIATPVVTNVAGARLTWEQDAGIEAIGRVADMPVDDAQKRAMRARIRRWVKLLEERGHALPR